MYDINVQEIKFQSMQNPLTVQNNALLYNEHLPEADFIELNVNQNLTSRQSHFKISKSNAYKVGNNMLATRLSTLNGKILLKDLRYQSMATKLNIKIVYCKYEIRCL